MRRRTTHGFAMALVTVAFLQPLLAQGPPPLPIQRFLDANPTFRLLAVDDVRDAVDKVAEKYFTPFEAGDLTGDGVAEVAAVIVQRGTPIRFGVVVLHGSRTVHWVVRPQVEKIVSVNVQNTRRLYIEQCLECDSNSWVRWNGSSYENALWIVGDVPSTYNGRARNRSAPLRPTPHSTDKVIGNVPECTSAKILQVLPMQANAVRWYRVEVLLNGRVREGFLPSEVLTDISCIG
jgi:hypothetical protein